MISITDHILRTAVQTDIDAANVFAADSQHDHDHAADKQIHSHQRTVARKDAGRVQNLFNDDDQTKNKTNYRAKAPVKVAIRRGLMENAVNPLENSEISFPSV